MHRLTGLLPSALVLPALLAPTVFAQVGNPRVDGGAGGARLGRDAANDDDVVEGFNAGLAFFVLAVAVLVIVLLVLRERRRRHARAARERQVAVAAAEAVRDDPAFAPAAVKAAAAELYTELQRAWSDRDDAVLERGLGPELLSDWRRRLKWFEQRGWASERSILEGPRVQYVGLVNLEGTEEDRVTVAITATLLRTARVVSDAADPNLAGAGADDEIAVNEYWTLGRHGDGWRVLAIDGEGTSPYHLSAPIVPRPEPGSAAG